MNRIPIVTFQPYSFINMGDPRMNLKPQDQANSGLLKMPQKRTSFTHKQQEELEAVFSKTMFPDKHLQKKLASQLELQQSTVKVWFRNRRFKMRKQKQQQQRSLQPSKQILPAKKNRPTSLITSTNPCSFSPVASSFCSLLPQPAGSSDWSGDSIFMESPAGDPQLEQLVSSVPALYSDAYDITQIMDLYSLPEEDETSSSSFDCLYQYLSPTRYWLEEQSSSLSTFAGPAVALSPGKSRSSQTSQGFAAYSLRGGLGCQNAPSRADFAFL